MCGWSDVERVNLMVLTILITLPWEPESALSYVLTHLMLYNWKMIWSHRAFILKVSVKQLDYCFLMCTKLLALCVIFLYSILFPWTSIAITLYVSWIALEAGRIVAGRSPLSLRVGKFLIGHRANIWFNSTYMTTWTCVATHMHIWSRNFHRN